MNLEDLVDDKGLQQDDFSKSGVLFGEEGQLEVVGWSGTGVGNIKSYIVKCGECSEDKELFGEGYFRSRKSNLARGEIPCGCSKKPQLSNNQFNILCSRKAKGIGYTFLGFYGEWRGAYTKIKMLCEKHGEWNSADINTLTNMDRGCPGCRVDKAVQANTKADDVMIASFFASGAFHPDTTFWRCVGLAKSEIKSCWCMSCPECGKIGQSQSNNLQAGKRSCACSTHRQQEGYINWLVDSHNNPIAIKFGIARDSKQRVKQQGVRSTYELCQHAVYTFPDVASCKRAERVCKKELECGVVLKRDMPDGYTETTHTYNLDKIIKIYEGNGGILQEKA